MRIAIIGNGDFIHCGSRLRDYDYSMAADGGANHCARLGIKPNYVLGDGDSIRADVRANVDFKSESNQDTTDLQKALHYVQSLQLPDYSVDLFCVTSHERLDHTLWALWLLKDWPTIQTIYTPYQAITLVRTEKIITEPAGTLFSLIPLATKATVNVTGAEWSGENIVLDHTQAGISNIIQTPPVKITIAAGQVLCLTNITWPQ